MKKTKTEVETRSFGTGGGITGNGPDFEKIKLREYDSLGNLIYESYKEISYDGCLAHTEKWDVTAKTPSGDYQTLELTHDDKLKITYQSRNGHVQSDTTIPYSQLRTINWLNQNE